jgi:hypothetical protein
VNFERIVAAARDRMKRAKFIIAAAALVLATTGTVRAIPESVLEQPTGEICGETCCVRIADFRTAHAGYMDDRALVVTVLGEIIAQLPTFGYLLNAFWSPDNQYVAVNNRQGNAGD